METGHPSTRAVNSSSGNRALNRQSRKHILITIRELTQRADMGLQRSTQRRGLTPASTTNYCTVTSHTHTDNNSGYLLAAP